MEMNKEIRSFEFEVRAENNEKHGDFLEGTPIVFNSKTNLGFYDELIEPTALEGCDLRDVRFLVNHNTDMIPLARSRRNNENSTMQMVVDENGMNIRVDLDTENNSEARALYSATKRGDLSGMSFMFTVDSDTWEDLESDHPTRRIAKIGRVFEVSAVTFPAYEQSSIVARSSADALEKAKAALEKAKTEARNDELRSQILRKIEG